jgi:hypothetical protein
VSLLANNEISCSGQLAQDFLRVRATYLEHGDRWGGCLKVGSWGLDAEYRNKILSY